VARRTDRIETVVRERPVPAFVCVTVLITWGIWWSVAFGFVEADPIEENGGFAPTIVGNDRVPNRPRCDPGDPVRLVDWYEGT
jgi:hypothetical protein